MDGEVERVASKMTPRTFVPNNGVASANGLLVGRRGESDTALRGFGLGTAGG